MSLVALRARKTPRERREERGEETGQPAGRSGAATAESPMALGIGLLVPGVCSYRDYYSGGEKDHGDLVESRPLLSSESA